MTNISIRLVALICCMMRSLFVSTAGWMIRHPKVSTEMREPFSLMRLAWSHMPVECWWSTMFNHSSRYWYLLVRMFLRIFVMLGWYQCSPVMYLPCIGRPWPALAFSTTGSTIDYPCKTWFDSDSCMEILSATLLIIVELLGRVVITFRIGVDMWRRGVRMSKP